jgi:lysophospholipase L1-like esterase
MVVSHRTARAVATRLAAWLVISAATIAWAAPSVATEDSASAKPPATVSEAESQSRPTLYLIGDSTVKNGRGDGAGGLWGWGQVLAPKFDQTRIDVENDAIGGRSSRTFLTEGRWDQVLTMLQPGDFVLMQFGHNDGGELFEGDRPRASLKGNGEEIREGVVEMTGEAETVHSYGWYLRHYIADAKAKGATPIVLSPVPRNIWQKDHVARASNDYGKWAAEAAREGGAEFVDLNEIIAGRYEATGEETVRRDYFTAADHTHTTEAGALVNADCVAAGIREANLPLAKYLVAPSAQAKASPAATDQ